MGRRFKIRLLKSKFKNEGNLISRSIADVLSGKAQAETTW